MELGRRTRIDDDLIAWDAWGDGPPVVLVHGFPSSSHVWRRVVPTLVAAGRRVHVLDLAGFGRSSRGDGQGVWVDRQADVVAEMLREWDLDRPTVVAHDMGAGSTVLGVVRHDVGLERPVLVSAAVLEPVIAAATEHMAAHLETYRSMPAVTWESIVRARLATTTHTPLGPDALEPYAASWVGTDGQAAYLRVVEQVREQRIVAATEALGRLDVPTQVVWGEEDTWLPLEMADRIRAAVPGAALTVLPGVGHVLPEDAPGALSRIVLEVPRARG